MSVRSPSLRTDIHLDNLRALPPFSQAPRGSPLEIYTAIRHAGFGGIQGGDPQLCRDAGLVPTAAGRVNHPSEAAPLAKKWRDEGYESATVHVGWGMESDSEALALAESVLSASSAHRFPLYIETHRATITQDIYRTVQLIRALPEVRFNGDFSHWYTGLELVYGDFEAKLEFLQPVFDRVRFLHGRIGTPGCIQVDIGDGHEASSYVDHFREMWTRSMRAFCASEESPQTLAFTTELLPPDIFYARVFRSSDGSATEESDRWQQALVLARIARECFAGLIADGGTTLR